MKPARLGEGAVDQVLRDPVVYHVEEADLLESVAELGRQPCEGAVLPTEKTAEIENRDVTSRRRISPRR